MGRQGWDIGRGATQKLYDLYRNRQLAEDKVAAIGRGAPNNEAVQTVVLKSAKKLDANALEFLARDLDLRMKETGALGGQNAQQMDMFGEDSAFIQEQIAIAKARSEMLKENANKIRAVSGVVKRPKVAKEMGVDVENPEAVRMAVEALQAENLRIANPDPAMFARILERAKLKPQGGVTAQAQAPVPTAGADAMPGPERMPDEPWNSKNYVPDYRSKQEIEEILKDFGEPVFFSRDVCFENEADAIEKVMRENPRVTVNESTGWEIHLDNNEIKKFFYTKPRIADGALMKISEIVRRAKYDGLRPDRHNRRNVRYHRFFAKTTDGKGEIPQILTVRELDTGYKKYYDLALPETNKDSNAQVESPQGRSTDLNLTKESLHKNYPPSVGKSQADADVLPSAYDNTVEGGKFDTSPARALDDSFINALWDAIPRGEKLTGEQSQKVAEAIERWRAQVDERMIELLTAKPIKKNWLLKNANAPARAYVDAPLRRVFLGSVRTLARSFICVFVRTLARAVFRRRRTP